VNAIARRDSAGARAAMRSHMNHAAKRFSKSWEKKKVRATRRKA
jgi:DNA-binding GntR family transcriptional regulator